jgi:hypothetical protein
MPKKKLTLFEKIKKAHKVAKKKTGSPNPKGYKKKPGRPKQTKIKKAKKKLTLTKNKLSDLKKEYKNDKKKQAYFKTLTPKQQKDYILKQEMKNNNEWKK